MSNWASGWRDRRQTALEKEKAKEANARLATPEVVKEAQASQATITTLSDLMKQALRDAGISEAELRSLGAIPEVELPALLKPSTPVLIEPEAPAERIYGDTITMPDGTVIALSQPVKAETMRPRPYQIQGIEFLREKKRAILADAPGLGKTFQATEAAELPAIVSCPLALVGQWKDFIETEYPQAPVTIGAYGDIIKRTEAVKEHADLGGWLIVNHDFWRNIFVEHPIETLICDEFHHFRNKEAKRSKSLWIKAQFTPRVYGLTATPIFKDVGDLWHLLHILDKKSWPSYWQFINQFAITSNYGYGTKVQRIRSRPALERATTSWMLGRSYAQVSMYLPERIDKHVIMHLTGDNRRRYNELRDYYRLELEKENEEGDMFKLYANAGAVLHALRKLTMTTEKVNAIKELIEDTPDEAPIIVFTWYRDSAETLAKALNAELITGEVKPEERRMRAQGEDKKRVRVATIASISEGVDLSDYRTVIFAEESYVPGQSYQALSRVLRHRTKTTETGEIDTTPVVIHWCRYANTVDQIVHTTAKSRVEGNALTVLKEVLEQSDNA